MYVGQQFAQPRKDIMPDQEDLLRERVDREIATRADLPTWSPLERFVLACRMLAAQGPWHGAPAGQITARRATPGTYYTLRSGVGADAVTPSSGTTCDDDR